MTALVSVNEILKYIPQRAPIVMVSEILACDETSIRTRLIIDSSNIFVSNGYLQDSGVIENIAQSAAAMTGYQAITNNQEVKRGFIGSVKRLTINQLPLQTNPIETEVKVVTQVFNATVIEGTVFQGNTIIATCEMNIFLEN